MSSESTKMRLEIGDVVRSIWKYEGQITAEYKNYLAIEKDKEQFIHHSSTEWLQQQIIPYTSEQINQERWFKVNCFDGGSILSCESRLEFIDRIYINNLKK